MQYHKKSPIYILTKFFLCLSNLSFPFVYFVLFVIFSFTSILWHYSFYRPNRQFGLWILPCFSYVTATIVLEHVDEQSCFSCHSWTNQQNSRELLVHFSIYCSFKMFLHTVSFPYLYFTTYSSLYSHSSQTTMCQFHIPSVSRFTLLPLTTNSFSNSIHFLLSFSNHHWANHSEKTMNSRETGFFLI